MATSANETPAKPTATQVDEEPGKTEFYLKYRSKLEDIAWLSEILNKPVQQVSVVKPPEAGGHHAEVFSLTITVKDQEQPIKLIAKLIGKDHSMQGFEREVPVYENFLSPLIEKGLINAPRFFFGDFDSETSAKIIILEHLDAVHCGHFFGATSPHNRGKNLEELCAGFPGLTDVEITKKAFIQVAKLHGAYWCRPKDQIPAYIRGGDWLGADPTKKDSLAKSVGEEQYDAIISFARNSWPTRHEKRANCKFNSYLEDIVSYALNTSTYETFAQILNSGPYTILHGDFYPANTLVEMAKDESGADQPKVNLIDFEVISVGPGPQDLAQWMISHVHPETRLQNEMELLAAYKTELSKVWVELHGAEKAAEFEKEFTQEKLMADYVAGGGKWIWLMAVCIGADSITDVLYQHFIDQLTHFFKTFDVQIEKGNVPTPRC